MDQETEIINQNTRMEKIRTFFLSNKKSLISALIIIILSVFGYFFYGDSLGYLSNYLNIFPFVQKL